jgi:hypothetical protein
MALKLRNLTRWLPPWSRNDGKEPDRSAETGAAGQQANADDVRNLRTVIAELGKELRKSKDSLQNDGVAVSSATTTVEVEINEIKGVDARLSFTVPGIGGLGGGVEGKKGSKMTTTIQVVLTPETLNPTTPAVLSDQIGPPSPL